MVRKWWLFLEHTHFKGQNCLAWNCLLKNKFQFRKRIDHNCSRAVPVSLVPIVIFFFFQIWAFSSQKTRIQFRRHYINHGSSKAMPEQLKAVLASPLKYSGRLISRTCQGSNRLAIVCLYAQVCHVVVYFVWYYKNLIHMCYHGWFTSCCSVPGLNTAGYITLKKKEKIKQYSAMYRWQDKLAPPFSHHGQPTSCSSLSGLNGLRTPKFLKGWVGLSQYCWTCLERPPVSPIINDNQVGGCNHLNSGLYW